MNKNQPTLVRLKDELYHTKEYGLWTTLFKRKFIKQMSEMIERSAINTVTHKDA